MDLSVNCSLTSPWFELLDSCGPGEAKTVSGSGAGLFMAVMFLNFSSVWNWLLINWWIEAILVSFVVNLLLSTWRLMFLVSLMLYFEGAGAGVYWYCWFFTEIGVVVLFVGVDVLIIGCVTRVLCVVVVCRFFVVGCEMVDGSLKCVSVVLGCLMLWLLLVLTLTVFLCVIERNRRFLGVEVVWTRVAGDENH